MLPPNPVSPLFAQLYEMKVKVLRENLARLDQVLSRHNFFDCQTVLQLQHPQSHRKALLLQGEMDVEADGADADRMPVGTGISTNFKPFTSYRWLKKTPAPNPYRPAAQDRLKRTEGEYALKTTTPERKRDLRLSLVQLRDEVTTLKKSSFLIGATDPYIVVPGAFAHGNDAPKDGDCALVVFADAVYPALEGHIGPNDRVGEASLRIAKQSNGLSTPYNRPVSDLKVTYLVFPGTADKPFGPPDLDKLQARCEALVKEIGGASVPLHHWENIIPPPPTPTPTPSPAASPTPTSTNSPSLSASPSATFAFPASSASGTASPSPALTPPTSPIVPPTR